MKRCITLIAVCFFAIVLQAQVKPFKFAFISDTHISTPDATPAQDLQRTIADINKRTDLDFVVLTGDITELGTNEELATAKKNTGWLKN